MARHEAIIAPACTVSALGDSVWLPRCKGPKPVLSWMRIGVVNPKLGPLTVEGEQAPFLKASVGQSPVIVMAFTLETKSANAHSDPLIEPGHGFGHLGHTEIPCPATQYGIEFCDDGIDISALLTARNRSDAFFKSVYGFITDANVVTSKAEPEKHKAIIEVSETRFGLVQ
jgi:hypothetical protein